MKVQKALLALALSLAFLILPVASASSWEFNESKVHFYMYGLSTCPHCRHMKQLIPEVYGSDKLTYYELNGNRHNMEVFENISHLTHITGVPAIGIVYDGQLVAVIEGEFNVSATPEIVKTAIDHNGTILIVGGVTYLIRHNTTEGVKLTNELYELFVRPTATTTTTSEGGGGLCGPAAIIGLSVIPILLRRRK
ncbi:glutaredoxin [Thermococcus gorgonarius]|uniref:Glutaredoxin n=2 Tax=Thermococcus gorgonarius TaxID=71997 RepID=A0A2Z2M7X1_THEGO|nr:glutaredoxin [Thermococcus gorgonarius]